MRPFKFYIENNKVVKQEKNLETSNSLLRSARIRWKFYKDDNIIQDNANILFEAFYEVIREIIQSEMAKEGYKPYSHEAIVSFAYERKILDQGYCIALDRYRVLRHDSMYYGKSILVDETLRIKKLAEKMLLEK